MRALEYRSLEFVQMKGQKKAYAAPPLLIYMSGRGVEKVDIGVLGRKEGGKGRETR